MNKQRCDQCSCLFPIDDLHIDDSAAMCRACFKAWCKKSALEAGIPLSVIEGKTKLSDHFSKEYIESQCSPKKGMR